ncbi:glutathionylspermidine synthase family protein [Marinobacter zhejiangensis]|uniref:Glutathionylspermidine synthase n=1 Tax=Marinobacter zhejiangensis TaxID=488535 RepID=A0A1I4LA82_9GAMM|nr:glutathionylspermidine synthase family protein [Marinobacter zhejiangensis]SFL87841.1 Glutathionylspermidine synthase [Marinobacter zhejiangensis]
MQRLQVQPRPDWCSQAEAFGFRFHTLNGEPYWDESACYQFTLREIEEDIGAPTELLHAMCLELVGEVVTSERLMTRLAIPQKAWDLIAESWKFSEPSLYGRMDFSYDGQGPAKFYEYNADTPTSLYETGFFQWLWLEQQIERGQLPSGADQFNRLQEALVERLGTIGRAGQALHLACCRDHPEDLGTIEYLADCAKQAGLAPVSMYMDDIGLAPTGCFTDLRERSIDQLFKLYPWEWMWQEDFSDHITKSAVQYIEPPWKLILSNKGILPLLWERYPDHPNLLPAWFADDAGLAERPARWVRKPFFSREGANVSVETAAGVEMTVEGPYGDGATIIQGWYPPPRFQGHYCLIGSWVVGNEAAGMGIREDNTVITRDTSRFLPHVIVD